MTLILPNSTFMHIPKTGGTWVRNAIAAAAIPVKGIVSVTPEESTEGSPGSWHNVPLRNAGFLSKEHSFCFVRNPLAWYQSYWAYKTFYGKWTIKNKYISKIDLCRSDDFQGFIDNVLEQFSDGYVGWLFDFYTDHATYVGKCENLQDDLITALTLSGELFSVDDIIATPRAKVSPVTKKNSAVYRLDQIADIMSIEQQAIRKYGYNNTLPFLRFN